MAQKRKFEKIAIANRGEVAVRIIHACRELGLETVLLHSTVDEGTMAYRLADETVCIGEAASSASYLNIKANVDGARGAGADAVHPGFGFLSENAAFASAIEAAGMVFIGPTPESIKLFGDKVSAKEHAIKAGAPVIPGYDGKDQTIDRLLKECDRIGYPVIVKATAGGGGRGMKVIRGASQAKSAIESAQREGQSAFGSGIVFLEKYLDEAKHIEVQIFGDAGGKVHSLLERECSVQRRHQKIIEEALSPLLSADLRRDICGAAVRLAQSANYRGAGTVEFLLQGDEFFFMEMNTRLQVEHPVTELVMGVDLVKAQILTAQGVALPWGELKPHGHAIECRIYAENPYLGGVPSTGRLEAAHWPHGPGRRFEIGFEPGDEITPHYDPMIAKVIVWDETRTRAIQKMRKTLSETVLFGVHTNIPLLQEILSHRDFVTGTMTTRFFETHFAKALPVPELSASEHKMAQALQAQIVETVDGSSVVPSPWQHPWRSS